MVKVEALIIYRDLTWLRVKKKKLFLVAIDCSSSSQLSEVYMYREENVLRFCCVIGERNAAISCLFFSSFSFFLYVRCSSWSFCFPAVVAYDKMIIRFLSVQ